MQAIFIVYFGLRLSRHSLQATADGSAVNISRGEFFSVLSVAPANLPEADKAGGD